jgi:hypothetical protein
MITGGGKQKKKRRVLANPAKLRDRPLVAENFLLAAQAASDRILQGGS